MGRPDGVKETCLAVQFGEAEHNPGSPWVWTARVRVRTGLQRFQTIISLPYPGVAPSLQADPGPFRALREALLRALPDATLNGPHLGSFERALQRVWAGGGAYPGPGTHVFGHMTGELRAHVDARDPRGVPLPGDRWDVACISMLQDPLGFELCARGARRMTRVKLHVGEKKFLGDGPPRQRLDLGLKLEKKEILALCALLRGLSPDAPVKAGTDAVGAARRLVGSLKVVETMESAA